MSWKMGVVVKQIQSNAIDLFSQMMTIFYRVMLLQMHIQYLFISQFCLYLTLVQGADTVVRTWPVQQVAHFL